MLEILKRNSGENFSILQNIYNSTSHGDDVDVCLDTMGPLFPGARASTLKTVINMTQTHSPAQRKMAKALAKYWGSVDKTYRKLSKRYTVDDDDDEDDYDYEYDDWYSRRYVSPKHHMPYPQGPKKNKNEDWYFNRRSGYAKGEYSSVNRKYLNRRKNRRFDCRLVDCSMENPSNFEFEFCGC